MALLWVVTPEALMDYRDFCIWREVNPDMPSLLSCVEDEAEFQEISYKSWMHLLAQIIKVHEYFVSLSIHTKDDNDQEIVSKN